LGTAFLVFIGVGSVPATIIVNGDVPFTMAGLGMISFAFAVQAFFAEFVGTFVLVFTVFGVVHRKASAGFAGVAIGLVVFAAIIPVAPTTGASINPARTFSPMLVQQIAGGSVSWSQLPFYLAAECLAGLLAAFAYVAISKTRPGETPAPVSVPAETTTAA
jgi:glycerol uptake facilitator protein